MYPVCDLDVDVRSVLGSIRVPTLVFHRRDNFWIPVAFGRYLAQHIADARFVEIEGIDHRYYQGNADGMHIVLPLARGNGKAMARYHLAGAFDAVAHLRPAAAIVVAQFAQ